MSEVANHYTYRITWSVEDDEYLGLCTEFPSLSWLDSSPEKALAGIRKVVYEVVEDMALGGEKVPEPLSLKKYSGKFQVRIPPETHRELAMKAAEENVSLNRLVSHKLSSH